MAKFDYEENNPQEILDDIQFEYPEAPWEKVEDFNPIIQIEWFFDLQEIKNDPIIYAKYANTYNSNKVMYRTFK